MNICDDSSTPYYTGQVPITENQPGTQSMGHEIAVISGPTILTLLEQNFRRTTSLATFNILSFGKKGKFLILVSLGRMQIKFWVHWRCQESGNLLQTVSGVDGSELSIDTSTCSANNQQNFDSAQYYGSTDRSTTPSRKTPSIKDGTAHSLILLTDENSTTPISVQQICPPVIFDRSRPFGNEIQNLPDYVLRTLFE